MPAGRRTPWLVCYDVADPSRLQRVHRAVSRRAIPFQYSVFLAWGTRSTVEDLLAEVETHIDPRCDDVRAYPLLTSARPVLYGRSCLPDGVIIGGAAGPFFHNGGRPGNRPSARAQARACGSQLPRRREQARASSKAIETKEENHIGQFNRET